VPRPLSSTDPGVWPPAVHSGRGFFGRCLQLGPLGRRVGPLAPKSCEGRIDLAAGALRTWICSLMVRAAACASLDVASAFIGLAGLSSRRDTTRSRHQFTQQLQPLCRQLGIEKVGRGSSGPACRHTATHFARCAWHVAPGPRSRSYIRSSFSTPLAIFEPCRGLEHARCGKTHAGAQCGIS
jgi:hypothetical protein